MNLLGWICMIASLSFVWGLAGTCYYLMLNDPETPIEEVPRLHSD
ncbi:MAG: hypothetical protein ACOX9B_03510 [Candidatus Xenobium sp.]|jgi:hypothetical protein